jgi:hypothetical protein
LPIIVYLPKLSITQTGYFFHWWSIVEIKNTAGLPGTIPGLMVIKLCFIDASYQVSVHLAEGFQRRRLKCEK